MIGGRLDEPAQPEIPACVSEREFLDLTVQEDACIELGPTPADASKCKRVRWNLIQADLAKTMNSSQSRVANAQAGDAADFPDLRARSRPAMGATRNDLAKIIMRSRLDPLLRSRPPRPSRSKGPPPCNCGLGPLRGKWLRRPRATPYRDQPHVRPQRRRR